MTRLWNNHRTGVIIALAVMLILAFTSLYVVGEEEQAVVIRTGEPVGVANTPGGEKGAGLYVRVPFLDSVRKVDKRLLDLEMTDEEVLSNDQACAWRSNRFSIRFCARNWAAARSRPC